jgi:transposase
MKPLASSRRSASHWFAELVEGLPDLAPLVEPLLVVRRVLREQIGILQRRLLAIVRDE